MAHWSNDAFFYHIYPLGFCGAPRHNQLGAPPEARLEKLDGWIPHMQGLGVNALYLGPVFESSAHGYDTADYWHVDRRLGTDAGFAAQVARLHAAGIRVVLDGVFNHVGRDFWAFRDVLSRGQGSPYVGWFSGLRFDRRSPRGDPFAYDCWNGASELVKLNLRNPEVREHLLGAVESWIRAFGIDGLRLDVADLVDLDFQRALRARCRALSPDFWLMGEVVHGDYRRWANPEVLDSVTNYECYKGLYSSHRDRNYFEIAYALNRQFGPGGLYRGVGLYNFADNHDVDRVASQIGDPEHLRPLYSLLFTMPGVPSLYYGSEWGIEGRRTREDDTALRPCLELGGVRGAGRPELLETIRRLAAVRRESSALKYGDYAQVLVASEQFAFARLCAEEQVVVAVNSSKTPAVLDLALPGTMHAGLLEDLLEPGVRFEVNGGRARIDALPACGARVMRLGGC